LTEKHGSKFGALVGPSDATEKIRNIGAQLQSMLYTTAEKRFLRYKVHNGTLTNGENSVQIDA